MWAGRPGAHTLLAPLYAATGMLNATACLTAVSAGGNHSKSAAKSLDRFTLAAAGLELALAAVIEARRFDKPYRLSAFPMLLGSGVPLLLRFFKNFQADGIPLSGSLAIVAGGLIMQIYVIYTGKESARHAQEYFEFAGPENPVRHHAAYPGVPQTVKVEFKANRKERARGRRVSLVMLGTGVFFLAAGILALSAGGKKEVAGSGSKIFSSARNAISDKLREINELGDTMKETLDRVFGSVNRDPLPVFLIGIGAGMVLLSLYSIRKSGPDGDRLAFADPATRLREETDVSGEEKAGPRSFASIKLGLSALALGAAMSGFVPGVDTEKVEGWKTDLLAKASEAGEEIIKGTEKMLRKKLNAEAM